jgi:hypothetical protein
VQYLINQPINFPTITETPGNYVVLNQNTVVNYPLTSSLFSSGITTVSVTPTGTGPMYVVDTNNNRTYGPFEVVSTLLSSQVQNVADGVLGSYQWDKVANTLTLYTQQGQVLAVYSVLEAPTVSSRQLIS